MRWPEGPTVSGGERGEKQGHTTVHTFPAPREEVGRGRTLGATCQL